LPVLERRIIFFVCRAKAINNIFPAEAQSLATYAPAGIPETF
jgi:hypothetical protein